MDTVAYCPRGLGLVSKAFMWLYGHGSILSISRSLFASVMLHVVVCTLYCAFRDLTGLFSDTTCRSLQTRQCTVLVVLCLVSDAMCGCIDTSVYCPRDPGLVSDTFMWLYWHVSVLSSWSWSCQWYFYVVVLTRQCTVLVVLVLSVILLCGCIDTTVYCPRGPGLVSDTFMWLYWHVSVLSSWSWSCQWYFYVVVLTRQCTVLVVLVCQWYFYVVVLRR